VREIAADTGKPANDQPGEMCAANCDKPASTRTNWANKAKEIAAGIARLAEGAFRKLIVAKSASQREADLPCPRLGCEFLEKGAHG